MVHTILRIAIIKLRSRTLVQQAFQVDDYIKVKLLSLDHLAHNEVCSSM